MDYEKNIGSEYPADFAGKTPVSQQCHDHIMKSVGLFNQAWAGPTRDQAGSAANSAISASIGSTFNSTPL